MKVRFTGADGAKVVIRINPYNLDQLKAKYLDLEVLQQGFLIPYNDNYKKSNKAQKEIV